MSSPPLPIARATLAGPRLFTADQVALATFLGSALAGGFLLALSHRRAKTGRAWQAYLIGAALTGVGVALALALPDGIGMGIPIASVIAMRGIARQQMAGIEAAAGGALATQPASWLATVGLSLGFLVAVGGGALAIGVGYAIMAEPASVSYGHDQDVQYADGATLGDARIVGGYLMELGFFKTDGADKTVRISRAGGTITVSFVVHDGAWDDPGVPAAFEVLRAELASRLGAPVVIHLCDDAMDSHRAIGA